MAMMSEAGPDINQLLTPTKARMPKTTAKFMSGPPRAAAGQTARNALNLALAPTSPSSPAPDSCLYASLNIARQESPPTGYSAAASSSCNLRPGPPRSQSPARRRRPGDILIDDLAPGVGCLPSPPLRMTSSAAPPPVTSPVSSLGVGMISSSGQPAVCSGLASGEARPLSGSLAEGPPRRRNSIPASLFKCLHCGQGCGDAQSAARHCGQLWGPLRHCRTVSQPSAATEVVNRASDPSPSKAVASSPPGGSVCSSRQPSKNVATSPPGGSVCSSRNQSKSLAHSPDAGQQSCLSGSPGGSVYVQRSSSKQSSQMSHANGASSAVPSQTFASSSQGLTSVTFSTPDRNHAGFFTDMSAEVTPRGTPPRCFTPVASYACGHGFPEAQSSPNPHREPFVQTCQSPVVRRTSTAHFSAEAPQGNTTHRGADGASVRLVAARSEVSFRCPRCAQSFVDALSAKKCCENRGSTPQTEASGSSGQFTSSSTAYRCPTCKQTGFANAQSAAKHCWQGVSATTPERGRTGSGEKCAANPTSKGPTRSKSGSPIRARTARTNEPELSAPGLRKVLSEESLATISTRSSQYLSGAAAHEPNGAETPHRRNPSPQTQKRKSIQRLVDQDTGEGQTVVHNGDGTITAWGRDSICSMLESEKLKVKKLIDSLNDLELQGLVHEFNQRLLKTADDYETLRKKLELIQEACDIAFFGLQPFFTEKELNQAYRKLARKLHPDKNGNTEEAKAQFQDMKDRYERLKKKIRERVPVEEADRKIPPPKEPAEVEVPAQCTVPEAFPDEPIELPDAAVEPPREPEEPVDRQKLDDACWRMLRRTKAFHEKVDLVHQQIDNTKQELEELRRTKTE